LKGEIGTGRGEESKKASVGGEDLAALGDSQAMRGTIARGLADLV